MRQLRLQVRNKSLLCDRLRLKTRVIRRRFRYEDGTRNFNCDSTGEEGRVSEVTLEEAGGVDRCSSPSNHDASGQVKSRVTNDPERSLLQSDDLDAVCWQSLSPLRKRRFRLPTQVAGVCRVVVLRCSRLRRMLT